MKLMSVLEDRKGYYEFLQECRRLKAEGVVESYSEINFDLAQKRFHPHARIRPNLSSVRATIIHHKDCIHNIYNDNSWCTEDAVEQSDFHYERIHEFEELERDILKFME